MSEQRSSSEFGDEEVDYRQDEVDLVRLHGSLQREHRDPQDGMEPVPLWLIAVFGIAVFWGGAYLMLYSGGFRADVFDERETTAGMYTWGDRDVGVGVGVAEEEELDPFDEMMRIGERFYPASCAACHQASGQGSGEFPPLVGTEWVLGSSERLAAILLHGVEGELTVRGRVYDGAMPGWASMPDERLAGIMTYIRNSWGNEAYPIFPEAVAYAREKYADRTRNWTEEELLAIPEDASIMAAVEDEVDASDEVPETEEEDMEETEGAEETD